MQAMTFIPASIDSTIASEAKAGGTKINEASAFVFSTACLALNKNEILFIEKILTVKPTKRIIEYAIESISLSILL